MYFCQKCRDAYAVCKLADANALRVGYQLPDLVALEDQAHGLSQREDKRRWWLWLKICVH